MKQKSGDASENILALMFTLHSCSDVGKILRCLKILAVHLLLLLLLIPSFYSLSCQVHGARPL